MLQQIIFSFIRKRGYHIVHESVLEQWVKKRFPDIHQARHYRLLLDEIAVDIQNDEQFMQLYEKCASFTMTSIERMYALHNTVQYIVGNQIPGAFVECGVWKGGSMMQTALSLLQLGVKDRDLYLYDTYAGLPEPTEVDKDYRGHEAMERWEENKADGHNKWCYAPLEEVKANLLGTGYPAEKIHFIQGKVEDTIPGVMPEEIALLRLDTDFYASTKHELLHLYPPLAQKGILIIDDYGHWQGQRKAVDGYFSDKHILLNRIDHTSRLVMKA